MVKRLAIWIFALLYALTATVSTVHSVDLFSLTAETWLAISTSIALELGAAACLLAAIIGMRSSVVIWMFCLVSLLQITANAYSAFHGAAGFLDFSKLFGLVEQEEILQRRVLAIVNGAVLPIVALGFAKCLSDAISLDVKPSSQVAVTSEKDANEGRSQESKTDSEAEPKGGGSTVLRDGQIIEVR